MSKMLKKKVMCKEKCKKNTDNRNAIQCAGKEMFQSLKQSSIKIEAVNISKGVLDVAEEEK